jgi:hypothetical protein
VGVARRAGEPRPGADQPRGDGQLDLVDDTGGEEAAVHGRAALDHQAHDAVLGEAPEHLVRRALQDHRVGQFAALGQDARVRVERTGGEHHAQRRGPEPAGDAGGAPLRRAHEQARVVRAHGARPDEDRVDARPLGVDPVEVGGPGEHEPRGGVVVEEPVDRHRGRREHVRALHPGPP